jgi:hypothetical protein
MNIRFYESVCEDCLIVALDGVYYPIDKQDDMLGQCFALSKEFYNDTANYMPCNRFKIGRLVLSVRFPNNVFLRSTRVAKTANDRWVKK